MEKHEVAERRNFLKAMRAKRGYVADFHKILASEDFEFLQAFEGMATFTLKGRHLTRKIQELILVALLCALRSDPHDIALHIRVAMKHGATKTEVLEAIELVLLRPGLINFMKGIEVWQDTVPVTRIEPDESE